VVESASGNLSVVLFRGNDRNAPGLIERIQGNEDVPETTTFFCFNDVRDADCARIAMLREEGVSELSPWNGKKPRKGAYETESLSDLNSLRQEVSSPCIKLLARTVIQDDESTNDVEIRRFHEPVERSEFDQSKAPEMEEESSDLTQPCVEPR
jgi:hypothetical protein